MAAFNHPDGRLPRILGVKGDQWGHAFLPGVSQTATTKPFSPYSSVDESLCSVFITPVPPLGLAQQAGDLLIQLPCSGVINHVGFAPKGTGDTCRDWQGRAGSRREPQPGSHPGSKGGKLPVKPTPHSQKLLAILSENMPSCCLQKAVGKGDVTNGKGSRPFLPHTIGSHTLSPYLDSHSPI